LRHVELWLEELGHADAIFPHDPKLAAYFVQWYDLLVANVPDEDLKRHYSAHMVKWAETAVSRSPRQFAYRQHLANAYWLRASLEQSTGRRALYEKGIDQFQKATQLYPVSPKVWDKYGNALLKYGEALASAGGRVAGNRYIADGQQAKARADSLRAEDSD